MQNENKPEEPKVETIEVPQKVEVEEIKPENIPVEKTTVVDVEVENAPQSDPVDPDLPTPQAKPATQIDGKDVLMVRSAETGDKVYAVRDGKRYWVRNPETLVKMGFNLGQEKTVTFSELLQYPEGEPIDLTVPAAEYPWNKPEVPKSSEPTSPFKVWN